MMLKKIKLFLSNVATWSMNLLGANRQGKVISLAILIHIAWRNLISKKLRSLLTLFGIIIGIGAIFFLFSWTRTT